LWYCGLLKPQTQTTEAERTALSRHAAGRSRVVEIGVLNGVTSLQIRKAMAPGGVLWAVDPFLRGRLGFNLDEQIARHTVGRSTNGTVKFVLLTGAEAAALYSQEASQPVDFLFIDGDHTWSGIDADWRGWAPLIGNAGIIALHDSRPYAGNRLELESVRYTQQVIRADPRFTVIDEVDSLTVLAAAP
jgi:predicted O-methyltransferase YrrM